MKRHLDLRKEDRILKAALAAEPFVERECFYDQDDIMSELSEWVGSCEFLGIKIIANSKDACEAHLKEAIINELVHDFHKSYSLLEKNKQHHFFL